ncbi:hypothetical protein PHAVU_005G055600 [Phaseolus vulgaris]
MGECRYSCKSADETLAWINEIVHFLAPYSSLINAHVVNFFKDRLWENVDAEWMECLRRESVQNLLLIPSGAVQDEWPTSLKEFILKLRSMVFCQEQADMSMALPGLQIASLNSVLAQGMNVKKKHEVEILSAVISTVANSVRADAVADVGAGQGYVAQVLAFQYQHPVIAIDACSHHGRVTDARAEKIKKYYTSQMIKSGSGMRSLNVPKTITCRILSTDSLKTLVEISLTGDDVEQSRLKAENQQDLGKPHWLSNANKKSSIVLAGLHACGDLSVTMLKTFLECKDVKAVVSLGCCYNLLSEERIEDGESQCGFPMSHAVRSTSLSLGKRARDLACQSPSISHLRTWLKTPKARLYHLFYNRVQRGGGAWTCMLAFTTLSCMPFGLLFKWFFLNIIRKLSQVLLQLGVKGRLFVGDIRGDLQNPSCILKEVLVTQDKSALLKFLQYQKLTGLWARYQRYRHYLVKFLIVKGLDMKGLNLMTHFYILRISVGLDCLILELNIHKI